MKISEIYALWAGSPCSWLSTKVNTEATGSFSFQNAFFYLQWGDDDSSWLSTKVNTEATGSFSFQNAFFYLQWGDDDWVYTSDDPIATSLLTLKKTRRKTKLHPHKQRSKYICRPEFVVETGNHFIWEFIPGHNTFNVPADAAILHHYRICEFGGDDCIQTASTVDVTTFKYRDRLVEAVGSLYEQYRKKLFNYRLTSLFPT
ncbi:Glycosyltransferase family 92 [Popillia japonica]|uniref:Glycosyltransferase family 92 protein n=1 Tax=Popillia japonica TaxID=7064 RepID=A0AAW1LR98_POPJA